MTVPGLRRLRRPALVLLLAACGDPIIEARIENRRPFDPLPPYADLHEAVEACSGRTGPFGRIRWFLASSIVADGRVARARWSPPHDIVIVAGYETNDRTVSHEMLHDLLDGDPDHRDTAWDDCSLRFG